MWLLSKALLLSMMLAACNSTGNGRYRDNADLERPPELPVDKQAAEQAAASQIEAPKKRHGKGLKSDVYMNEASPPELKIKRPFDESWSLIQQAIQYNELKITDQDRSKGFYYVAYNGNSFFNNAASLFEDVQDKPTYLLKVEPQGEETRLIASLASKEEQSSTANPKNGGDAASQDQSRKLLELLFDTLHDDVKDQ